MRLRVVVAAFFRFAFSCTDAGFDFHVDLLGGFRLSRVLSLRDGEILSFEARAQIVRSARFDGTHGRKMQGTQGPGPPGLWSRRERPRRCGRAGGAPSAHPALFVL